MRRLAYLLLGIVIGLMILGFLYLGNGFLEGSSIMFAHLTGFLL